MNAAVTDDEHPFPARGEGYPLPVLTGFAAALAFLFLLIYYPVFTADYAYLDEAHQLWHHADGSNYQQFAVQGRALTGFLIDHAFGMANSVSDLKHLRTGSLIGWMLFGFTWIAVFNAWIRRFGLDRRLLPVSIVFIAGCPSVIISVGWASCLELSVAMTAGLLSGAFLGSVMSRIAPPGVVPTSAMPRRNWPAMVCCLLLGIISLFFYQNALGLLMLPFMLDHLQNRSVATRKRVLIAVFVSMLIYMLYFILFRWGLSLQHLHPGDRTGITHQPLRKIGFFFSGPLPMAFSPGLLYQTQGLLPQLIAPLVLLLFAVSIFRRFRDRAFADNLGWFAGLLLLMAFIYLPSMISRENFASYRTLFPLTLTVFLMIMIQCLGTAGRKMGLVITVVIALVVLLQGFLIYRRQFIDPLQKEYASLQSELSRTSITSIDSVYFIRPDKRAFQERYGIRGARDEFGSPSTLKDWVPEPLIRLWARGIGASAGQGHNVNANPQTSPVVIQYSSAMEFLQSGILPGPRSLVIDMDSLIRVR